MSISRLPREQGIFIRCNGTTDAGCPKKNKTFTANITAGANRSHAAMSGWGRGLRLNHKRRDLCPDCMPLERQLAKEQKEKRDAEKLRRDELKKAKMSADPLPKKPRKKKGDASTAATSSPSAEPAPAPAT